MRRTAHAPQATPLEENRQMEQQPISRVTLDHHVLDSTLAVDHITVRRITIPAGVMLGAHWHNGPVFGVVESGSVYFQVGTENERILRAGDTFLEPGNETITRFDATDEGVTFLGWFPLSADVEPELIMGPLD
jgi:quercetin dioxygenase-like cupin family protein